MNFGEKVAVKTGLLQDTTGGAETARISMVKGHRLCFLVNSAAAAIDMDVTLRQHDAATGGNSKDLVINSPVYKKVGAATSFTKVTAPLAANFVEADFNGAAGLMMIEVLGEDLDRAGDFTHVSLVFNSGATARLVSCEMMVHAPKTLPAYEVVL